MNINMNKPRKEDRRNAYTKKVIRDAVFQLLQEKPLNKITVSEVCKIADINRSTFYLHYMDCQHVLEQEQDRFCDKLITYMEEHKKEGPLNIILELHKIIREDNDLYLLLIRSEQPMTSFKKFTDYCKQYMIHRLTKNSSLTEEEADWIAQYIIAGSFSISLRFAHEPDDNLHREEIIHHFIENGLHGFFYEKEIV